MSSMFSPMMKAMGPSGAFGFYAAICGFECIWTYFFYPEVSQLAQEEIKVVQYGLGLH